MNLNNKLPPSPRSRHARKPLIKLVGHHETLSLDRNKQEPIKSTLNYSLDRIKPKANDESSKQPQNSNLHQEKHSFFGQKSSTGNEQKQCHNHKGRIAVSIVEKKTINYYCFECSLYEARRGSKVKQITHLQKSKGQNRQSQIKKYVEQAQQAEMSLSHHYNEIKKKIKKQVNEIDSMIEREKTKTAQRIAKLKQDLCTKIEELQRVKYEQVTALDKHCKDVGQMRNVIKCNRLDVISNLQGCLYEFSRAQFMKIMGQYEAQIKHSRELAKKSEVCLLDTKLRQSDMNSGSNLGREQLFTFSKYDSLYETPKTSSKLEGVPTVSSSYGMGRSSKQNARKNSERGEKIIVNSFN